MPAAISYTNPNSPDRMDDFSMQPERRERSNQYKKAEKYYKRNQKKFLDNKPGEPDDNVVMNNTRVAVDRTLSMLLPAMPQLELDPLNVDPTFEELWLAELWRENGGIFKMTEVAQNGAFVGHCYVRIKKPLPGKTMPRIINLNPESMITFWRSGDIEDVLWHEQYWTEGANEFIIDYVKLPSGFWHIYQYFRSGSTWELLVDESWDSYYPPVIDWKHLPNANNYYGLGECDNLDLDDMLNLLTSEAARITRYHASPKTVGLGIEPDDIKPTAIDGLWTTAATKNEADIYNLEMSAPAAAFVEALLSRLYDAKMSENRVVVLRGDIKDFQRVTNPGIRTVFMDMLSKNHLLHMSYGKAIQEICMSAAFIANVRIPKVPTLVWSDPLPTDDKELADIAEKELAMGVVSRSIVAQKRGYNYKEVLQQLGQEQTPD